MKTTTALLVLLAAAAPASAQTERQKTMMRIDQRLKQEFPGFLRSMVESGRESARAEIAKVGPLRPLTFEEEVAALARRLPTGPEVNGRLREVLQSPAGPNLVRDLMQVFRLESTGAAVARFFDSTRDGRLRLKEEYLDAALLLLEPRGPKPAPVPMARQAWLGIEQGDLNPRQREAAGLKGLIGVKIHALVPGGPAEKSGLKAGDVLAAAAGRDLTEESLRAVLEAAAPGSEIEFTVVREKQKIQVKVKLGQRP